MYVRTCMIMEYTDGSHKNYTCIVLYGIKGQTIKYTGSQTVPNKSIYETFQPTPLLIYIHVCLNYSTYTLI